MSKIDELIAEFCPDGVEFRHIWELTIWDKKFIGIEKYKQPAYIKYNYLLANDLKGLAADTGNVKLLYTGVTDSGVTTEKIAGENLCEGEIVAIPWGTSSPWVQYYKGKFVTADNRIATSNDTSVLDNKFLFYWMSNNLKLICSFYRGSGIQHPSMAKVLDMLIPIPPLPIQQKIVRILDKFTTLEAELEAELEARKRQYNYYRNELLSNNSWSNVSLGELCTLITKGTTPKKYSTNGIRFIKTESFVNNIINNDRTVFISEETHLGVLKRSILKEKDILFTIAGATIGKCASVEMVNLPANTNQALAIIRLNPKLINQRFVFYVLKSIKMAEYIEKKVKGSAQPNLNLQQINEFQISVPTLEEQARIVAILDRFDTLVNDITQGLPAEIAARHQQYEYYRDKLLTFKEKV